MQLSLCLFFLYCQLLGYPALASPVPDASPAAAAAHTNPSVRIQNGTVIGRHDATNVQDYFLGIPYAKPPLGELRFHAPEPMDSWSDARPAVNYGSFCRGFSLGLPGFDEAKFNYTRSEDCLTLNVVRPSGLPADFKVPVLVWIHGGGFQEGGSGDLRYNMSYLVNHSVQMGQPIIGVSINYRLSGWGFLAGRTMLGSGLANLGLQDQRFALHWIQDNIAAFGGDSARVTIQGESAGAVSVGHHLLAYGGRDDGLFRAAIAESGGPVAAMLVATVDQQDQLFSDVLKAVDCPDSEAALGCLRAAPADTVDAAFQNAQYSPVIDGGLVPDLPSVSLRNGSFVKVPLLIGTNTNEGTPFAALAGRGVNNTADFAAVVKAHAGIDVQNSTIQALFQEYFEKPTLQEIERDLGTVLVSPDPSYGSLYGQTTLYLGDYSFIAGRRLASQLWSRYNVPNYSYRFDVTVDGLSPEIYGVGHFQEVAFVFNNLHGAGYDTNPFHSASAKITEERVAVSQLMCRMWLSFVNTLSPNNHQGDEHITTWPSYSTNPVNLVFGEKGITHETDDFRKDGISLIIEDLVQLRH